MSYHLNSKKARIFWWTCWTTIEMLSFNQKQSCLLNGKNCFVGWEKKTTTSDRIKQFNKMINLNTQTNTHINPVIECKHLDSFIWFSLKAYPQRWRRRRRWRQSDECSVYFFFVSQSVGCPPQFTSLTLTSHSFFYSIYDWCW